MGYPGSGLMSAGVVHRCLDIAWPGFGAETWVRALLFHFRHTPIANAPSRSLSPSLVHRMTP